MSAPNMREFGFSPENVTRYSEMNLADQSQFILLAMESSGIFRSILAELPEKEDAYWELPGTEMVFPLGKHDQLPLEASLRVFMADHRIDLEQEAASVEAPDWSIYSLNRPEVSYALTDIGHKAYTAQALPYEDSPVRPDTYYRIYNENKESPPQAIHPSLGVPGLRNRLTLEDPDTSPVDFATDIVYTPPGGIHSYFAPGNHYAAMLSLVPTTVLKTYFIKTLKELEFFRIPTQPEEREIASAALLEAVKNNDIFSERVELIDLPEEIRADLVEARTIARTKAIPTDKSTRVGCVIASGEQRYYGMNIKRNYGIHTTHAEEMAVNSSLFEQKALSRVALYAEIDGEISSNPAFPCGNCREILLHALKVNGQKDIDIYSMSSDESVIKVPLSTLLPLADTLLKNQ